jgi:hypothetical protein
MTGKRVKLVDQTPFWASGAAKTPGSTAQPACGLRGPRRVLQSRRLRRSSGECWLNRIGTIYFSIYFLQPTAASNTEANKGNKVWETEK